MMGEMVKRNLETVEKSKEIRKSLLDQIIVEK